MAVGGRPELVVLRALGLGDFLTGLPAYRALGDAFPGYRRVLVAPAALAPLARHAGVFDEIERVPPHRADLAVNLHGRGPRSHRVLLRRGPRRLLAFAHADVAASAGMPPWRPDEHEVARWCRLLSESGIPADPTRLDLDPPPIDPPEEVRDATLIHPGAASGARRWPAERFAAVARAEAKAGRRVVVTAGPREAQLARAVAGEAGILARPADLMALAALVAAAGRVVCGDTGLAHLATALGTPSVVLFGPVSPARWGPPPERAQHRALWTGRTGDPHAAEPDPGLLEIDVADVLQALEAA